MKDRLISESRFVEDLYGCLYGFDFDLEDVLNVLKGVESVDSLPVVHGHWVERFTGNEWIVHCSNCKTEATEMADYHTIYSYCPYCGAKMDEKDGEQDGKDTIGNCD